MKQKNAGETFLARIFALQSTPVIVTPNVFKKNVTISGV